MATAARTSPAATIPPCTAARSPTLPRWPWGAGTLPAMPALRPTPRVHRLHAAGDHVGTEPSFSAGRRLVHLERHADLVSDRGGVARDTGYDGLRRPGRDLRPAIHHLHVRRDE